MNHTPLNDRISVSVSAAGAELVSLKNAQGLELLWQAGPVWPRPPHVSEDRQSKASPSMLASFPVSTVNQKPTDLMGWNDPAPAASCARGPVVVGWTTEQEVVTWSKLR
jgi:hypothetical protein